MGEVQLAVRKGRGLLTVCFESKWMRYGVPDFRQRRRRELPRAGGAGGVASDRTGAGPWGFQVTKTDRLPTLAPILVSFPQQHSLSK